jgi:hypothetical protein
MDWALNVDTTSADAKVTQLAGITLAWLCIVASPLIRDRAAESLRRLVAVTPALLEALKTRLKGVDEPRILDLLSGC